MSLQDEYLSQNHGNRTATLFDLAAGFMRGNPEEMRLGYDTGAALLAAASVLGNREQDGETMDALLKAVPVLDALAAEAATAS